MSLSKVIKKYQVAATPVVLDSKLFENTFESEDLRSEVKRQEDHNK